MGGGRGAKSESVWVAVVLVLVLVTVMVTVSVAGDDPSSDRVKCGIASEGREAGLKSPSSGSVLLHHGHHHGGTAAARPYRQEREHFLVKNSHGVVMPLDFPGLLNSWAVKGSHRCLQTVHWTAL